MTLESLLPCLPAELRTPATEITKIAVGLSGAAVYRVAVGASGDASGDAPGDAPGDAYVLKIAAASESLAGWRARLAVMQHAAAAGVAPRVVHADEEHRAIVSAFVADRSFIALYADPRTQAAAIEQLGRALRRVHELPLPDGAETRDRLEFLAAIWSGLAGFALPAFVGDAVRRVLEETPPPRERALVLAHNDVNPTNVVYDGERVMFLDWDTAGPNDPFFDLAAAAVFLRMDDAVCARLLAAYDGAGHAESDAAPRADSPVPPRFGYMRRVVAALCGALFLHLSRHGGHPGATTGEVLALGDVYARMRAGALSPRTPEGQWAFGLALVQASLRA
jgi:aminoglycoside phosphotransferase (APT) family kinase protein